LLTLAVVGHILYLCFPIVVYVCDQQLKFKI
jgi:hypothetical protein